MASGEAARAVRAGPFRVTERNPAAHAANGGRPGAAGDLAAVYAALAASRRETAVIKDALRRWQSDQARARDARGNAR